MKVEVSSSGDFKNTEAWLARALSQKPNATLNQIGAQGVAALSAYTPIGETGKTAAGWSYKVTATSSGSEVAWYNHAHPETSANVALLIQLGHGTGTGGYVPGYDYINPALQNVFSSGAKKLMEVITK